MAMLEKTTRTAAVALLALALACGGGSTPEAEEPTAEAIPPAPSFATTRVLTGPDGARVNIAEFGTDEAYFQITGVRTPAAGFVFLGTVSDRGGGRIAYITQWDGDDYYPVHRETRPNGETHWRLFAPGLSSPLELEYDEALSAQLDGAALHATHVEQTRDGSLEAAQTFDREAAEAHHEEALARDIARTEEACGSVPAFDVRWDSVSDEVLLDTSVSSYCGTLLSAMRSVCRYPPGQALVASLERAECVWAEPETWSLEREGATVTWTVSQDTTNLQQKAHAALLAEPTAAGGTLDQAIAWFQTDVCLSADEEHVLVVHPHRREATFGISYGTAETLYHSPQPEMVGRGWFFDPRQFNEGNNSGFRGFDLRFYSHVEVDREAGTCTLTCGERESEWALADGERGVAILREAETRPAPFDREPYALARDQRGVYYYVDRGNTDETRRDYHVYRGRRGAMERLEMRDIVSDSEGEIFSTASGNLRLVVDQDEGSQWIRRGRPRPLRRVPVAENYHLIMHELGVYLGERFELPCDDH